MGKRNKSQRFVDTITAGLVELGAKEYKTLESRKSFHLDTVVGNIDIHVSTDVEHCYTMFARFDNVEEAKAKFNCNPYSGKYNTHVGNVPDMTPEKAAEICLISIEATQPNTSEYKPQEPSKKDLACNAIRDMFFHKHYNGIVPVADLDVVKNGKQWHSLFTKKGTQEAVQELIKDGYITLDGAKENWIWGFAGMNQQLFNNNLIHDIGTRKERGIDPTANELEEIRTFAKSHIDFIEHFGEDNSGDDKLSLMKKMHKLFPSEIINFIDDSL